MKRPIQERLAEAKALMLSRRRTPRVFFLGGADFDEFEATDPPKATMTFYGEPLEVYGFDGIAVRQSESSRPDYQPKLFCCVGTSVTVRLA